MTDYSEYYGRQRYSGWIKQKAIYVWIKLKKTMEKWSSANKKETNSWFSLVESCI